MTDRFLPAPPPLGDRARRSARRRGTLGIVASAVSVALPLLLLPFWGDGQGLGRWALVFALIAPVLLILVTIRSFLLARNGASATGALVDRTLTAFCVLLGLIGGYVLIAALAPSAVWIAPVLLLLVAMVLGIQNVRTSIAGTTRG